MRVRIAQILVVASIVWGTLAFGGAYEWASRSLAVMMLAASAACFIAAPRAPGLPRPVIAAMVLMTLAIAVQLIPLSQTTLAAMNPARHELLRNLSLSYRFQPSESHPLSINPPLTMWAMIFFAVTCVWMAALVKLLSATRSTWLAASLTWLGCAIAVIGIVQNAVYSGKIYGFWAPENIYAGPFGPFVNRNHYAGWMLMVIPVAGAWFVSRARRGFASAGTTWRNRFLWLSSTDANVLVLLFGALLVMLLSMVLTASRSGILVLVLILAAIAAGALRSRTALRWRIAVALVPLVLAAAALFVAGPDELMTRFQMLSDGDIRQIAWADAVAIGRKFSGFGIGLNTYGTATMIYEAGTTHLHFAQAHNDYLQLWAEGGALLLVPAVALVAALIGAVRGRFRRLTRTDWVSRGAVLGMIAVLVQELVEFSLQMPANLLVMASLCALAMYRSPAHQSVEPGLNVVPIRKRS